MILLGSIDRLELLALCDWWLSPERRLLMQVRVSTVGGWRSFPLLTHSGIICLYKIKNSVFP